MIGSEINSKSEHIDTNYEAEISNVNQEIPELTQSSP